MYPPVTIPILGIFALFLLALLAFVEVGIIEVAYQKLGISHRTVITLLLLMIFGSYINVPIASVPAKHLIEDQIVTFWGIPYVVPHEVYHESTVIAINVGGALIPAIISLYLLLKNKVVLSSVVCITIVSLVVYRFSRIVPGVGIAVPTLIPGLLAAGAAYLVDRRRAAPVAYIAGTIGCLVGADIFNLGIISQLNAAVASIGGAGTFDGVFVSGIVAVLLA